ncbi:MAG TPA: hypothetical protein VNC18_10675 [Gemmatimonadaceae bacterium]|jgi:hypothetical protein|nr:hypothetical protein [Gemmatimonadaceae bacterium]
MTQPTTLAPNRTRTQLVVGIALFALLFLLGAQIVDPRISRRVVAAVVAITGIISGIFPALGTQRPQTARWLARASGVCLAIMLGVLARMLFQSFRG